MVEFLTLFLGLVTGVRTVALAVAGPIDQVEIRLDGEVVTTLDGEPWAVDVDFGTLRPHELVAIARDPSGREVGQALRWVNIYQGTSTAAMSFDTDRDGRPRAVEFSWETIGRREPRQVDVFFDGEPLAVTDLRRVPLPPYDPGEFHHVSATVQFDGDDRRHLEAGFGGVLGDEISTDLTAWAVSVDKGRLPPRRKLHSWFLRDGEPLRVHGVEKRPPRIVVVRDPSIQEDFDRMARHLFEPGAPRGGAAAGRRTDGWDPSTFFAGSPEQRLAKLVAWEPQLRRLKEAGVLGEGADLFFVSPIAAPLMPADVQPEMFRRSPALPADAGGLLAMTQQVRPLRFDSQIADAVALAAMLAHSGNRRRAVVLLLGGSSDRASALAVEEVREYLRALQVPLFVWAFEPHSLAARSAATAWGAVRSLGDPSEPRQAVARFEEAVTDLARALRSQRIVWLQGRHLPGSIELAAEAEKVRPAGS